MNKINAVTASIIIALLSCGQSIAQRQPKKIVVLTFDDAVQSQYTIVAPLLKKYHFKATFYVCEFPGWPDSTNYMSWKEIKQLADWGFEIGNHTWHHTNVDEQNEDELRRDIAYIESKCDSLHIPKPTTFAYPAYRTDEKSLRVLKEMGYTTARIGGDRYYNPKQDNSLLIPSYTMLGKDTNNTKVMQQAWDESAKGHIVIITIHGVPDKAHPWVSTPPEIFEKYLQYLHDHHYKVIAMKSLGEYIKQN